MLQYAAERRRRPPGAPAGVPALVLGKLLFDRSVGGPLGVGFGILVAVRELRAKRLTGVRGASLTSRPFRV